MKKFEKYLRKENISFKKSTNEIRVFYFISHENREKSNKIIRRAKRFNKYIEYDFRCNYEILCIMFTRVNPSL